MFRKLSKIFVAPKVELHSFEPDCRDLFENMDEGFASCQMIYDKAGKPSDYRHCYVNSAFAKQMGLSVEQITGRTAKEVFPKIESFWIETFGRVVESGKSERFENTDDVLGKIYDIKAWRSSPGCFAVLFTDISGHKKLEEIFTLQAAALESAANGVVTTDTEGVIQWVNPAFTRLTGYSFKEVVGKSVNILNSGKQDKIFYQNLWETILAGKTWHGELVNRKKDGSLYTEEQTITPVMNKRGKIVSFIAIKQDVTIRKKLEKKLNLRYTDLVQMSKTQEKTKSAMLNVMEDLEEAKNLVEMERAKYVAMLTSIGEGLIAVDNNRNIIMMNEIAEDLLGWKAKELIGKDVTNLPLQNEEGKILPLNKRPTTIALATGEIIKVTHYFLKKDKTRFPLAITATPIKLGKKIIGLVEIIRDVSQEQAVDKAKSEFVSLASHQLRTPLGIMKWYLEALASDSYFKDSPDVVKKYYEEIFKSNERILSLVRDLLSVSRIDQGRVKDSPSRTNIATLLKEVVGQLKIFALKKDINLKLSIEDSKFPIICIDVLRLHEVIENLISNAIEYSKESGDVDVNLKKVGHTFLITIKDMGIGISAKDQKKLFTKFFRSEKAIGNNPEGSGLGLYVVKSYLEGWGGSITVESVEDSGSTFTIKLPIKLKAITDERSKEVKK